MAFVAGSFAAVLLVASLVDPDLFLHFEITKHRTVLFYLGVFGTVLAVARGMIPEDRLVFDPEHSLREVVQHTHYLPTEWKGKLHSQMVSRRPDDADAIGPSAIWSTLRNESNPFLDRACIGAPDSTHPLVLTPSVCIGYCRLLPRVHSTR